jgi:hypothetical protein
MCSRFGDARSSHYHRLIADKLGISKGSVQTILKEDLNMRKLCAKVVPKVLTREQKQRPAACCQDQMENEFQFLAEDDNWR